MITPRGERIYRFYPWESRIAIVDDYLYTDVSIYDYLKRLHENGEDISRYQSIWYYFWMQNGEIRCNKFPATSLSHSHPLILSHPHPIITS